MSSLLCSALLFIGYGYAISPCIPAISFSSCLTALLPVPDTDWYVEITTRFILYFLCSGANAITNCIVEQLGLAMILSALVEAFALISGITNFLSGSMRQAEELSITVVPASANFGAHSNEVSPPAEKMAISGLAATASAKPIMVCS